MSRSIRKETSSLAFGMVGRFGGSSAGFVVTALNAASAASREVVVLRVLSAGILTLFASFDSSLLVLRKYRKWEQSHPLRIGLLRARRERPRGRSAAQQRYELSAPHSITSSAVANSNCGMAINAACRQISGLS
jgi:hypothetical protein